MAGCDVPKGHGAIYISYTVHGDPDVFQQPGNFLSERWSGRYDGCSRPRWTDQRATRADTHTYDRKVPDTCGSFSLHLPAPPLKHHSDMPGKVQENKRLVYLQ